MQQRQVNVKNLGGTYTDIHNAEEHRDCRIATIAYRRCKTSHTTGSFWRIGETIDYMEYVVISTDPEKVIDDFVAMAEVYKVLSRGKAKH